MKKFITLLFIGLSANLIYAQCSDLFISEYVEGWSNNKALEIYNPTPNPIDLSYYSISRYTNGEFQASTPQQLEGTIQPYTTFVIGLDKRDPNGTGFEAPMWDGYYTYVDSISGEEVTTYNVEDDLQGAIDFWANGTYYSGTDPDSAAIYPMTMFYNGNDAVTLEIIGGGLVDLFGRVGEDPGAGWSDSNGILWTKDHTLIRKPEVTGGVTSNPLVFDPSEEWDSLSVNSFTNLGYHDCDCDESSETLENNMQILIYPNPVTSDIINVESHLEINKIKLYNSNGQIIIEKNIPNLNAITINRPKETGIYYLSIQGPKVTRTELITF